jgi:Zn-dependent protease with chaperone function
VSFGVRLSVIALSAFSLASLIASALVPWLARRVADDSPERTMARLLGVRLLPLAASTAAMALAALSFVRFEPRTSWETTGITLQILAVLALALPLGSLGRLVRVFRATRRTERAWMAAAERIDLDGIGVPAFAVGTSFPIVAVVGILRPRLVIAQSVLAHCSPEQLGAVLAHEAGHVRRRDNARRTLLATIPDVLAWLPAAKRLADAWHTAAEDAADDDADRVGPTGRLLLAEALIRVARLAPPGLVDVPVSALFRGEDLNRRIRRLLAPATRPAVRTWSWQRALVGASTLFCSALLALHAVHALVEVAVTFLP